MSQTLQKFVSMQALQKATNIKYLLNKSNDFFEILNFPFSRFEVIMAVSSSEKDITKKINISNTK